uniref:Uncharacterized protein n=1 Tax=Arundo donax TaxID=35708 RepID=A0A0A8YMT1_ARUDO
MLATSTYEGCGLCRTLISSWCAHNVQQRDGENAWPWQVRDPTAACSQAAEECVPAYVPHGPLHIAVRSDSGTFLTFLSTLSSTIAGRPAREKHSTGYAFLTAFKWLQF